MTIEVFAVLKDYFQKEFEIAAHLGTVADLRQHLADVNPASADILSICRFAVQDEFVMDEYRLTENDRVIVIPPSSGG